MSVDKRRVIVCSDHADGSDSKRLHTIINKLKSAGFNAEWGGIGPNKWTHLIRSHHKTKNTIIFGMVNGFDAGVIAEATSNYGYNKANGRKIGLPKGVDNAFHGSAGFLHNSRNNTLVLGCFCSCSDAYHEDSIPNNGVSWSWAVRAHDDNYSPRSFKGIAYPIKLMREYGIHMVWAGKYISKTRTNKSGDWDGSVVAQGFIDMFTYPQDDPIIAIDPLYHTDTVHASGKKTKYNSKTVTGTTTKPVTNTEKKTSTITTTTNTKKITPTVKTETVTENVTENVKVTKYRDENGNVYSGNDVYHTFMKPSCGRTSRHPKQGGTWNYQSEHWWLNKCPICGKKGVLTNAHKRGVPEGEITIRHCSNKSKRNCGTHDDRDFCGVCGYEKVDSSKVHLTEVFPFTTTEQKVTKRTVVKPVTVVTDDTTKTVTDVTPVKKVVKPLSVSKSSLNLNEFSCVAWSNATNYISSNPVKTSGGINVGQAYNVIWSNEKCTSNCKFTIRFTCSTSCWRIVLFPESIFLKGEYSHDEYFSIDSGTVKFNSKSSNHNIIKEGTHNLEITVINNIFSYKIDNNNQVILGTFSKNYTDLLLGFQAWTEKNSAVKGNLTVNSLKKELLIETTEDSTVTNPTTHSQVIDDNETNVGDNTVIEGNTTDKTLQSRIIKRTYTEPYYQQVYTTRTNELGSFFKELQLPFAGEYKVNYFFSGSKNYMNSSKTVNVDYNSGNIFIEELLETIITRNYSDGTVQTERTGNATGKKHTKTLTETVTYKEGVAQSANIVVVDNDNVDTTHTTQVQINNNIVTDTTATTKTSTSTSVNTNINTNNTETKVITPIITPTKTKTVQTAIKYDTNNETAITTRVSLSNNKPNIAGLGTDYEWANEEGTYTITSDEILRVEQLDSQCKQLFGFVPRYTFFRKEGSNTKYIISREKWNVIARDLHKYHVDKKYESVNPPYSITVNLKGDRRYYPIYYDAQEWINGHQYTCGPTAMSMISQGLCHYVSEKRLSTTYKTTASNGTDEDKIINYSPKEHMKVSDVGNTKLNVINALNSGAMILWHIKGHYMCTVAYNPTTDKFLGLNPSGPSHRIEASRWNTWQEMMNANRRLHGNGFSKVVPSWNLTIKQKEHVSNYYSNMGGKYTPPNNNENPRSNDNTPSYTVNKPELKQSEEITTENSVVIPVNEPTVVHNNLSVVVDPNAKDPFTSNVPCILNNEGKSIPDVSKFTHGKYSFVWADSNKKYSLSKDMYREVMVRDAKTMQINNMRMSKYVMFRTIQEPDTYHITYREKWNCIEKAINYYLVYANGGDYRNGVEYPSQFTVDLGGVNKIAGQKINLKNRTYNYWFVADSQDNLTTSAGTCGPTSASMISQFLHNFTSEKIMRQRTGVGPGGLECAKAVCKSHANKSEALGINGTVNALKSGKPVIWHCHNHYVTLMDISDDGNKINVFNPARVYSMNPGWQTVNYVSNRNYGSAYSFTPNWSISEAERSQLQHVLASLGGSWVRKQKLSEWQQVISWSLSQARIWNT